MGEREYRIADDELDQPIALLWVERRNRGVGHPNGLPGFPDPRLKLVICGKRGSRCGGQACAEEDGWRDRPDRPDHLAGRVEHEAARPMRSSAGSSGFPSGTPPPCPVGPGVGSMFAKLYATFNPKVAFEPAHLT